MHIENMKGKNTKKRKNTKSAKKEESEKTYMIENRTADLVCVP
jgi:hypothetical protein